MNSTCFCGGHGSYTDYNCGSSFEVTCSHCNGTGTKQCQCAEVSLKCGDRRGSEIVPGLRVFIEDRHGAPREDKRTAEQIEDDDIHWNFTD